MTDSHNYPSSANIHRETLPNGITVLVFERPGSQSVTIEGYLPAGALAETPELSGLANYTAVSLMRGSQQYSFDDIYEKLESVGAELGFSSGYHLTSFSAQSLAEDADLVLDLLADVMRQPVFPEPLLNQLKGQIITGLQMRANDTQQMASRTLRELIYPNHPYGRSQTGSLQTVPALSIADVQQFHTNYYGPNGLVICFVGALTPAQAVAKVSQTGLGIFEIELAIVGPGERVIEDALGALLVEVRAGEEERICHASRGKRRCGVTQWRGRGGLRPFFRPPRRDAAGGER